MYKKLNYNLMNYDPACNHLYKVNNKNTKTRREICSKFTIKTPERRGKCRLRIHFVPTFFPFRSCRPELFCKKRILQNLAGFTRKNLCRGLFFNKVASLRPAALLRDSYKGVFEWISWIFYEYLFFWWLLPPFHYFLI